MSESKTASQTNSIKMHKTQLLPQRSLIWAFLPGRIHWEIYKSLVLKNIISPKHLRNFGPCYYHSLSVTLFKCFSPCPKNLVFNSGVQSSYVVSDVPKAVRINKLLGRALIHLSFPTQDTRRAFAGQITMKQVVKNQILLLLPVTHGPATAGPAQLLARPLHPTAGFGNRHHSCPSSWRFKTPPLAQ